jgi:hypothetical protein
MEQMKMDGLQVVTLDYQSVELPETVRKLKPAVYKDGDSFCCLLGPDPQEGVFGCGDTQDEALADWNNHLVDRVAKHAPGDEIADFVIERLRDRNG